MGFDDLGGGGNKDTGPKTGFQRCVPEAGKCVPGQGWETPNRKGAPPCGAGFLQAAVRFWPDTEHFVKKTQKFVRFFAFHLKLLHIKKLKPAQRGLP